MAVRTCRKSMAIVCVGERDSVKDDYRRRAGQRECSDAEEAMRVFRKQPERRADG